MLNLVRSAASVSTSSSNTTTDLDFCQQHLGFSHRAHRVLDEPSKPDILSDDVHDDGEEEFDAADDEALFKTERHNEDFDAIDDQSQISTVRSEEAGEPTFKIVALDDLTKEQIARFADARGVPDTHALLDEIDRADAWSFTSRPQDLQEVIDFWNIEKRIGTRLELMRKSIERRLTERDEKRGYAMPIAPALARVGAKLVAAAATLTQNPAIRVPDGAENPKGIPLRAVLPDWDNRLQNTLLSFPIFDNAIYGTVRFHHRSVREYLTAEWLDGLLSQPVSRRAVEQLFFQEKFGLQVIVPAMRPILPWLAILNDRIRDRVREIDPELIFFIFLPPLLSYCLMIYHLY